MLCLELAMAAISYMKGAMGFWSFDIYASVGVSLLTFSYVKSSSVG